MPRFKHGQLKFYKTSTPIELRKYVKDFPDHAKMVDFFLKKYSYNYTKKRWDVVKDEPINLRRG